MIDFLIWFWNAGELLMIIGVFLLALGGTIHMKNKLLNHATIIAV